jgi:hypothetical protein
MMSTARNLPGPNMKVSGFGERVPVQPDGSDVCVSVIVNVLSGSGVWVYEYQNQPWFPPGVQPSPESGFAFAFSDHWKWKQTPGDGSAPLVVVRG